MSGLRIPAKSVAGSLHRFHSALRAVGWHQEVGIGGIACSCYDRISSTVVYRFFLITKSSEEPTPSLKSRGSLTDFSKKIALMLLADTFEWCAILLNIH